MSSEAVIAREVAVVVREREGTPGYWRPFVVRHVLMTLLFVGVIVVLTAFGYGNLAGLVRGTALALAIMAGLTAFDLWQVRRRLRRALLTLHRLACPPGTRVQAVWSSEDVVFRMPLHEIRLELATVTAGRHVSGVLLLDQGDAVRSWVVPDELLGPEALVILRDALGPRLREVL